MTVNICDHICALQWRNEYKRSSQLWTSSWNKTLKIQARSEFEPITSAIPVQRFTHWANMPICELRWRNEDRLYSFLHHSAHIWSHIFTVITHRVDHLPIGLLAQLVERCTGIAEVMGSNPVRTWIFSGLISSTSSVVFIAARIAYIRLLIITMWDSRKEGQGRKKAEFTRIPTVECFSLHLMLDRSEFKLPV